MLWTLTLATQFALKPSVPVNGSRAVALRPSRSRCWALALATIDVGGRVLQLFPSWTRACGGRPSALPGPEPVVAAAGIDGNRRNMSLVSPNNGPVSPLHPTSPYNRGSENTGLQADPKLGRLRNSVSVTAEFGARTSVYSRRQVTAAKPVKGRCSTAMGPAPTFVTNSLESPVVLLSNLALGWNITCVLHHELKSLRIPEAGITPSSSTTGRRG